MMKHLQRIKEENPNLTNAGKPWSLEEQTILLQRIKEGKSVIEIGEEFGRTSGGISARLRVVAFEMYKNGSTVDIISETTKLPVDDIEKTIKLKTSEKIKHVKSVEEKIMAKEPIQAKLITIPQSDIMEMKLMMLEIRDLLKKIANQN